MYNFIPFSEYKKNTDCEMRIYNLFYNVCVCVCAFNDKYCINIGVLSCTIWAHRLFPIEITLGSLYISQKGLFLALGFSKIILGLVLHSCALQYVTNREC